MKLKFIATLAFGSGLLLQSCQNADKKSDSHDPARDSINNSPALNHESQVNEDANRFIESASAGGMLEVELGKLAATNASRNEVKVLAATIVKDHQAANERLKAIANEKGIIIPEELPADKQSRFDEMKGLKGEKFDKAYLNFMESEHHKTIEEFEKVSETLKDQELKAFATETLPVLKKHHDETQKLK